MKCDQQALFRYTWAGRDESYCCLKHAQQIMGVAQAMGYYVQLIPLSGDEQMKASCQQETRDPIATISGTREVELRCGHGKVILLYPARSVVCGECGTETLVPEKTQDSGV